MRSLRRRHGLLAFSALGALLACGGSNSVFVATDGGRDAVGADSSVDAGGDAIADGAAGCDPTRTPSQDACVITDAYGIFVAPSGSDSGQGTMASPFLTVGHAILSAKQTSKRVYVCAATYAEQIVLNTAVDGVSLYGGLVCPGATGAPDASVDAAGDAASLGPAWSYGGQRAVVAPSTTGYALEMDSLTSAIDIEDMEFDAQPGGQPGASSVAAFASGLANATLRRVKLVAGNGAAGLDADDLTGTPPTTTSGTAATGTTGGTATSCTCTNGGTSGGGMGGNGGLGGGTAGGAGSSTPTITATAPDDGAGGAASASCTVDGAGHNGAPAAPAMGGAGATTTGTLAATGWTPGGGVSGASGNPGQGGGGGGGATTALNGGAGSGGCGGCGGAGGAAGGGGGGSIALESVASAIVVDACVLVAGTGMTGGKGGAGQSGGSAGGGAGGNGGCSGGQGGQGGAGGGGGGGAGGVSIAIAYTGTAPTQQNGTTLTAGTFGQGGQGGQGAGQNGSNGTNGVAIMTQSF